MTTDRAHDVDLDRWHTHLDNPPPVSCRLWCERGDREAEVLEPFNSTPGAVKQAKHSLNPGATSIDLFPQEFERRDSLFRRPREPVVQARPLALVVSERRQFQHALQAVVSHCGSLPQGLHTC